MAKCKKCEGYGLERDPEASDGWARDAAGNGIVCREESGGCGGSGVKPGTPKEEAPDLATPETLPEQRG